MSTAITAPTRNRVLRLYKEILKLGKHWKAKDAQRTLIEREDILNEATQAFRENKNMSTSLTNSSAGSLENTEPERNSGISASNFTPATVTFTRCYFAGTKIAAEILNDLVKLFSLDYQFYTTFVKSVLCSELLEKYPTRKSYRRNLLKLLIEELEIAGVEVQDELYVACASCMLDASEFCFRIFFTNDLAEVSVVIRESTEQLCHGTTGLSVWQASCDLSNFLCQFVDLSNTTVLELGAGCGLTGIAIARSFSNSVVFLSDYDPRVLVQLEFNVEENVDKRCSPLNVLNIDWTSFSVSQMHQYPDVVIAADVVYDSLLLPALCNVLRLCLQNSLKSRAYVASTLRDPMTLRAFRENLDVHELHIKDEMQYQYGTFTFLDGTKYKSASIFPHTSTLDAPTLIFEIVAKDLKRI